MYHLHGPTDLENPRIVVVHSEDGITPFSDLSSTQDDCQESLRNWIGATMDWSQIREDVYLISLAAVSAEAADLAKAGLLSRFPEARLIVLLGSEAHRLFFGSRNKPTMEETIRAYDEFLPFFPLPLPGLVSHDWLNRNPWFEQTILQMLRRCVALALERNKL
ncbi:MAG: uracil glycosylase superfamily protein [Verrucomicrobiales bacterium]|nr:uracil glycosylase superfamily protein [Verrucomicrobiales bacterium]